MLPEQQCTKAHGLFLPSSRLIDLLYDPLTVAVAGCADIDDQNFGDFIGVEGSDECDQSVDMAFDRLGRAAVFCGLAEFIVPAIDTTDWAEDLNAGGHFGIDQSPCHFLSQLF